MIARRFFWLVILSGTKCWILRGMLIWIASCSVRLMLEFRKLGSRFLGFRQPWRRQVFLLRFRARFGGFLLVEPVLEPFRWILGFRGSFPLQLLVQFPVQLPKFQPQTPIPQQALHFQSFPYFQHLPHFQHFPHFLHSFQHSRH